MVVRVEFKEMTEKPSPTDEGRFEQGPALSSCKKKEGGTGGGELVSYSPVDRLLSSERLDGFMEVEKRRSFAGLDEGGGMLILGRSIVVFVCSVPACTPFRREDGPFVADKRV